MNPILNPFEELLVGLVKAKVEFITVGGMACAMNGYLRSTEDVDILIKKDPENVKRLLHFLTGYGEGFGKELSETDFADEEGAIRVIESFPIDIFVVMAGQHFEDFQKQTKTVSVDDTPIPYLDHHGLIKLKTGSVREKDKIDVYHLNQIKDGS